MHTLKTIGWALVDARIEWLAAKAKLELCEASLQSREALAIESSAAFHLDTLIYQAYDASHACDRLEEYREELQDKVQARQPVDHDDLYDDLYDRGYRTHFSALQH